MSTGIIVTMEKGKIRIMKSGVTSEQAPALIEQYERENDTPCTYYQTDEQSAEMVLEVVNQSQLLDRMLDGE